MGADEEAPILRFEPFFFSAGNFRRFPARAMPGFNGLESSANIEEYNMEGEGCRNFSCNNRTNNRQKWRSKDDL